MAAQHYPDEKTREKVRDFVILGVNQDRIARYFDISVDTLARHYRKELDEALYDALAPVAKTAIQMAQDGHPKMIELVLKYRAGWAKMIDDDKNKDVTNTLLEKLIDKL